MSSCLILGNGKAPKGERQPEVGVDSAKGREWCSLALIPADATADVIFRVADWASEAGRLSAIVINIINL